MILKYFKKYVVKILLVLFVFQIKTYHTIKNHRQILAKSKNKLRFIFNLMNT